VSARQCPSCGGFCRKSGCERLNTNHPDYDKTEWKVRGVLAESLKCWCRLTGEEAAELVELLAKTGAQMHAAFAAGAASRDDAIADLKNRLHDEKQSVRNLEANIEALRADALRYRWWLKAMTSENAMEILGNAFKHLDPDTVPSTKQFSEVVDAAIEQESSK